MNHSYSVCYCFALPAIVQFPHANTAQLHGRGGLDERSLAITPSPPTQSLSWSLFKPICNKDQLSLIVVASVVSSGRKVPCFCRFCFLSSLSLFTRRPQGGLMLLCRLRCWRVMVRLPMKSVPRLVLSPTSPTELVKAVCFPRPDFFQPLPKQTHDMHKEQIHIY